MVFYVQLHLIAGAGFAERPDLVAEQVLFLNRAANGFINGPIQVCEDFPVKFP